MGEERAALVVIGGGITGLCAALTWALHRDPEKEPVLLLEEQRILGGCVTSFRRQGYLFDTAQLIPDVTEVLAYLGVKLELLRFADTCARVILVDPKGRGRSVIPIPGDLVQFRELLCRRYPGQSAAVSRFLHTCQGMYDELCNLKVEPRWYDLALIPIRCPHLVANANRTYQGLLDSCGLADPELCDVLQIFAAFAGMPAERVAALLPVTAMMTSLQGAYRPRGGFIQLPYALARRVKQLGGRIRTRAPVRRIHIEGARVVGIELADGEVVSTGRVVSTIDPVRAMRELVGMDVLGRCSPDYARRIESLRLSTSSLHISLGLEPDFDLRGLELDGGYNVVTTGHGTFERLFSAFDRGELGYSQDCFHTAVICPSLVTQGRPTVEIRVVPVPFADWGELRATDYEAYTRRKQAVAAFFIEQVERYAIPDLRQAIRVVDIATPATFARYTGTLLGQNYDMAPYPDNFGRKRLPLRTPIKGLYQPKLSHGIWPSMMAGMQAVDMMLDGAVMHGYTRYSPSRDPAAPRRFLGD